MSRKVRHFGKIGLLALAATSLVLPPALASMSRVERIGETRLSETLLGQFTPASGDPRLIARYEKMTANSRSSFSFTPAVSDNPHKNRAITVVIRAQDSSSKGVRTAALATPRSKTSVAIAPIAYNLGASVGFDKFVTPAIPRGTDISHLPQAQDPREGRGKPSRFATQMRSAHIDPAGASDRITTPGSEQAVDVVSSYRVTKNLDVTAGVRYKSEDVIEPLTDARRDSQAVYIGTAFRF